MSDADEPGIYAPIQRLALSPPEAAASIGVSLSWLRTQMRDGGLPYSRIGGRVLIRPLRLTAWLEQHETNEEREAEEMCRRVDRGLPPS
jgi:excisionase family DNA binding protein